MRVNLDNIGLLKEPFGQLIADADVTQSLIQHIVAKSSKIITVGDATTKKFVDFGLIPDLSIIDGKEKRMEHDKMIEYLVDERLYFENKQGELNEKIIAAIQRLAINGIEKKLQFVIKGEEDLLALPIFMYGPDGWTIFYGQPNEGLVVVKINEALRNRAKLIFNKVFNTI